MTCRGKLKKDIFYFDFRILVPTTIIWKFSKKLATNIFSRKFISPLNHFCLFSAHISYINTYNIYFTKTKNRFLNVSVYKYQPRVCYFLLNNWNKYTSYMIIIVNWMVLAVLVFHNSKQTVNKLIRNPGNFVFSYASRCIN